MVLYFFAGIVAIVSSHSQIVNYAKYLTTTLNPRHKRVVRNSSVRDILPDDLLVKVKSV